MAAILQTTKYIEAYNHTHAYKYDVKTVKLDLLTLLPTLYVQRWDRTHFNTLEA